jgi:hypothetical protein
MQCRVMVAVDGILLFTGCSGMLVVLVSERTCLVTWISSHALLNVFYRNIAAQQRMSQWGTEF